jgi:hypothetical protein
MAIKSRDSGQPNWEFLVYLTCRVRVRTVLSMDSFFSGTAKQWITWFICMGDYFTQGA